MSVPKKNSIAVPYFKSGLTILAPKADLEIGGVNDLTGKSVAAVKGSTEHGIMSREPSIRVIDAYNYSGCVSAVLRGDVEAAVLDVPVALLAVKKNPERLRVILPPFEEEWYGIYMQKDNKKLFWKIRSTLRELRNDGTMDRLRES